MKRKFSAYFEFEIDIIVRTNGNKYENANRRIKAAVVDAYVLRLKGDEIMLLEQVNRVNRVFSKPYEPRYSHSLRKERHFSNILLGVVTLSSCLRLSLFNS